MFQVSGKITPPPIKLSVVVAPVGESRGSCFRGEEQQLSDARSHVRIRFCLPQQCFDCSSTIDT